MAAHSFQVRWPDPGCCCSDRTVPRQVILKVTLIWLIVDGSHSIR